jgi:hypothetical protein
MLALLAMAIFFAQTKCFFVGYLMYKSCSAAAIFGSTKEEELQK